LKPRVKTKNWDSLFGVTLTGDGEIPINKRGSGTRRLVLLNFFRAEVEQDSASRGAGVIYAVEEPETSQHPNNQRMLIDAFEDLVASDMVQVLLTTHTPGLARRFDRSRVRIVELENGGSTVSDGQDDEVLTRMVESLGILPDHDVKAFVGVEGKHDISFLKAISKVLKDAGEGMPDLDAEEANGRLVFIPCGGSSVELWVTRLKGLGIPEFQIFDRDVPPPAEPHYSEVAARICEFPYANAVHTSKRELENYLHVDAIRAVFPGYTGQAGDFEDIPTQYARDVHEASIPGTPWDELTNEVRKSKRSRAKKCLNNSVVAGMTPELLTAVDPHGEVRGWLSEIRQMLDA
jgi:putative ATP-dependent endonuclease of the OLD family